MKDHYSVVLNMSSGELSLDTQHFLHLIIFGKEVKISVYHDASEYTKLKLFQFYYIIVDAVQP